MSFDSTFTMKKKVKISETKLQLKPLVVEDTEVYFKLLEQNRDHINQFGVMSEARYKTQDEIVASILNPLNPNKLRFSVWKDSTFIGIMSLIFKENKQCEVGGWIGKQFTRRGYASEAIRILIEYAHKEYGCTQITATTYPENLPSQKMLQKCGFVLVKKMKRRYYFTFKK